MLSKGARFVDQRGWERLFVLVAVSIWLSIIASEAMS